MTTSTSVVPLRPARPSTTIAVPPPVGEGTRDELISNLPLILGAALDYLLSEFDYEGNLKSNTAIAARLLAITVERLRKGQS